MENEISPLAETTTDDGLAVIFPGAKLGVMVTLEDGAVGETVALPGCALGEGVNEALAEGTGITETLLAADGVAEALLGA